MKTFTVDQRIGIPDSTGRMQYLFPNREYKIDARRKGFFNPASQVISKDLYEGIFPEDVPAEAVEPNNEEN